MLRFVIFSIVFLLSTPALADWVMLKNGDRLSGTITQQTANGVSMNTPSLGEVMIAQDKIYSVHQGDAPRVLARELRTGQPMSQVANATPPPTTEIKTSTPAPIPAPAAKKDEERKEGVFKWSGRVSAGGTLQDGNSHSKSITADADIKARDKNNRFTFGAEANWAEEEGVKTDNDQKIEGTYDRFLTDKWFVGGHQSLEKDEFEQLDLRSQTGLFAGYQFYERDDLNLQIKAGPEYIYDKFEDGTSESDIALGWALDYDQKLFEEAVQAFHKHEFTAPFADTSAFLFESETGVRVPIGERLDASLQVDFDWDNEPLAGVQESDTTYALKLGYGW